MCYKAHLLQIAYKNSIYNIKNIKYNKYNIYNINILII